MYLDPQTHTRWLANCREDLKGWEVLHDSDWKHGVRRYTVRRLSSVSFGSPRGIWESRTVYVREHTWALTWSMVKEALRTRAFRFLARLAWEFAKDWKVWAVCVPVAALVWWVI